MKLFTSMSITEYNCFYKRSNIYILDQVKETKLTGVVARYKGNGRTLGYPTANFYTSTNLKDGVYFGYADLENFVHHPTLIFIGVPTTLGDTDRRVEAHLLDIPDKDYYGSKINLYVNHFHRDNQTFPSIEALLELMHADEAAGREWFNTKEA